MKKEFFKKAYPYNAILATDCPDGYTKKQRPSIFHAWNNTQQKWELSEDFRSALTEYKERQLEKNTSKIVKYADFEFEITDSFIGRINSWLLKKDKISYPQAFLDNQGSIFYIRSAEDFESFTDAIFMHAAIIEFRIQSQRAAFQTMPLDTLYNF